jgi:chemotaxis protein methyltransferase CheR
MVCWQCCRRRTLHSGNSFKRILWEKINKYQTCNSTSALSAAKSGIYTQDKLKSMPTKYLDKYFNNMGTGKYSVKSSLRDLILFKRLNLMRDTFPFSNKFDIIFCRNVMIYFDKITRDTLISKYHTNITSNGILFIGHSETIGRNSDQFNYLIPAVYRKKL